jgi:hypothetical protein
MEAGVLVVLVKNKVRIVEAPAQLFAETLMVPEENPAANCSTIEFVPCPLTMLLPAGAVHV